MDYTINGVEIPSVSKLIGLVDKSEVLIPWAVNAAVDYIQDTWNQYERETFPVVTFDEARKAYKEISNTALDVGSAMHHIIENLTLGRKPALDREPQAVKMAFTAYEKFKAEHQIKVIESEKTVYHRKLLYAGTFDVLCELDGVLTILDWKTSRAVYDTHFIQCFAYAHAREAISGELEITREKEYIVNGKKEVEIKKYKIKFDPLPRDSIKQLAIVRLDKKTGEYELKIDKVPMKRRFKALTGLCDLFYNLKNTRRLKNNPRAKEG